MDQKEIDKMRTASHLLPDPGGEVVRKCLDEIERLRSQNYQLQQAYSTAMGGSYSE